MLVGSQTFPKNISEYEFAGGIKGEPIPVVRGKTTDLLLPANAELVVEGTIEPNSVRAEGPFGEFPGYYGRPEAGCPLVNITAVHYRSRPILTNALMADYPSCEQGGFFSVIRSAKIWDDFDKLGIPGIVGIYSHPAAAGGFGMTVISLEQRYAGHAAQALALAAQCPGGAYYTKWIIAVDEDIDPTDTDQVIWAMASRCNPIDDNVWKEYLGKIKTDKYSPVSADLSQQQRFNQLDCLSPRERTVGYWRIVYRGPIRNPNGIRTSASAARRAGPIDHDVKIKQGHVAVLLLA